jgi:ATP-dependent DNA helicase RecG
MLEFFYKDIKYLKGVGEKRAKLYKKLGIESVGALLYFFPRDYKDWSPMNIMDVNQEGNYSILAKVATPVNEIRIKNNMILYKFLACDQSECCFKVTIFNNKYLAQALKLDESYYFLGKIIKKANNIEMVAHNVQKFEKAILIKPIYQQTSGLTSNMITYNIKNALELLKQENGLEIIPLYIRKKFNLIDLYSALCSIHLPKDIKSLNLARRRFIFEEFFILHLTMIFFKMKKEKETKVKLIHDFSNEFNKLLTFKLTESQARAISECVLDMKSGKPMNRLLEGDVGSGKTIIAISLCYNMAKNGYQSAFMVPTEILAVQHYNTISKLLKESGLSINLITSSTKEKEKQQILKALKQGEINILVGTHSLISDCVLFKSLGLVITDEQHRFGVMQRQSLALKGNGPHTLVMSATPIPRTLALIIYGDLEISVLNELPPNRKEVNTVWIDSKKKGRAFSFIRDEIDKGRQAYIVCPVVQESEINLISAENYYKILKETEFSRYKVGLLHGKQKPSEKNQVMSEFLKGNIDVLITTTVVEVGMDVKNATIMMIENAERFGLSQLHQLRGRIGRNSFKSYCILVSDSRGETAVKRLSTMCETNNGFEIAETDLKLRGPGDFFGLRQHGLPLFKIASISDDMKDLKLAKQAAVEVLNMDANLSSEDNKGLKKLITNKIFISEN